MFDNHTADGWLSSLEGSHQYFYWIGLYYLTMTQFVFLFPQTAYEQAKEVHEAFSHTFTQITNIMMNNAGLLGQQLWTARKVITRHYCYWHFVFCSLR